MLYAGAPIMDSAGSDDTTVAQRAAWWAAQLVGLSAALMVLKMAVWKGDSLVGHLVGMTAASTVDEMAYCSVVWRAAPWVD